MVFRVAHPLKVGRSYLEIVIVSSGIPRNTKARFDGACFGAVSAPILSARVPLRASAALEKERFHYEHSSCFHERRLPR